MPKLTLQDVRLKDLVGLNHFVDPYVREGVEVALEWEPLTISQIADEAEETYWSEVRHSMEARPGTE